MCFNERQLIIILLNCLAFIRKSGTNIYMFIIDIAKAIYDIRVFNLYFKFNE